MAVVKATYRYRLTSILTGRTFVALGTALASMLTASSARAADRWETLEAIHWVENPDNSPKPGRFGELGAYQFRASTWRMHSRRPFAHAVERTHSDEVAIRHYEWLKQGLGRGGVPVTTYNIAVAWNAGLTAAVRGRVSAATRNYAQRVDNLASELQARSAPPKIPAVFRPVTPEKTLAWAP